MTAEPASILSPAALRLFDGYDAAALADPESRLFVLTRLLEEGDCVDLRVALAALGECEVESALDRVGRHLSARSRVFWFWLLRGAPAPAAAGSELWPLA